MFWRGKKITLFYHIPAEIILFSGFTENPEGRRAGDRKDMFLLTQIKSQPGGNSEDISRAGAAETGDTATIIMA